MRYGCLGVLCFLLVGCFSQDLDYYRVHPEVLRAALQHCPKVQPRAVSCYQLAKLARSMNSLARELQQNPQSFGHQTILLQNKLSSLQGEFKNNPQQTQLQHDISETKQDIADRNAVIRWLESPEK